jgi:hypothetical protein
MNKKISLVAGIAIATAGIYSASLTAATVTGTASANVLTPLGIANGANSMNFGDVAGDATNATTVVLTSAGTASSVDGASTAGSPTAADFNVTGSGTLAYDITLPTDGTIVLTNVAGPDMSVDGFSDSLGSTGALTAGAQSFTVGATLTINANQAAALYSGSYDVTVNYQ